MHVCSTKRALALVLSGKAEIVINGRGTIHSAASQFEIPSVIKLSHMVRRPRPRIALSKREILRRDDYTCQYCGRKMRTLTLDHVVPRRYGGPHSWENLVAACSPCNRRKGASWLPRPTWYSAACPLNQAPRPPTVSAHIWSSTRNGPNLLRVGKSSGPIAGTIAKQKYNGRGHLSTAAVRIFLRQIDYAIQPTIDQLTQTVVHLLITLKWSTVWIRDVISMAGHLG